MPKVEGNVAIPDEQRSEPVVLDDPTVLTTWCLEFGITEVTLREAVARVGTMPSALRFYLGPRQTIVRTPEQRAAYEVREAERKARRRPPRKLK